MCPAGYRASLGRMRRVWQLSIPYETDRDLDEAIYDDILYMANWIAESRYCFIETDIVAVDDPDRSW
jgi:hypothetical protein